jgi:hypothetical protein
MKITNPPNRRLKNDETIQQRDLNVSNLSPDIIEELKLYIQNALKNAVQQVQSFNALQRYLDKGQLTPEFEGWPISADLGLRIVEELTLNDYSLVIEFGSGSSTELIASALKRRIEKNSDFNPWRHFCFEHELQFYEKTNQKLINSGLEGYLELKLSPLQTYKSESKGKFSYYSCSTVIKKYFKNSKIENHNVLVLVDGPPARIGPLARYPALPILLEIMPKSQVKLLIDDYDRPDEQAMVELWTKMLKKRRRKFSLELMGFKKKVCIITIL